MSLSRHNGAHSHLRSSRLPNAVAVRSSTEKSVPLSEPSVVLLKTSRFSRVLPSTTSWVATPSPSPPPGSSLARHGENCACGSRWRSSKSLCRYLRQPPNATKATGGSCSAAWRRISGQSAASPPPK
eukprot:scaffold24398_cov133-Isochrysis_galbana.AAC.8